MPDRARLFTQKFATLWFFQFATFFAAFQLFPVIPFRILALGGTKAAAGSFLFVYTLSSATAAPIMGAIADHFGRKRILIVASLLFIVFSLLYAVVTWLPLVLLIGVAHGSLWSGILAAAGAIMTDYIPPSRRTEGLAYWGLAPTAAVALAPMVGLFVYRHGWLTLCLDLAAISTMTSIWATRLPVERPASPHPALRATLSPHAGRGTLGARMIESLLPACGEKVPEGQMRGEAGGLKPAAPLNLRELWDWPVVKATLSLTVTAFGYGGITSYVAILSRERNIQPESLFFTVFAIATIAVRVLTSRLGDRFGPQVLLYPAFVAMPVALAILSFASTRAQLVSSAILFGLGLGSAFPAFMTLIVGATDERRRARTFGSVIWAFDTGIGIGSLATGAIGQHHGLGSAFAIAAGLSCLSIPIFLTTARRFVTAR